MGTKTCLNYINLSADQATNLCASPLQADMNPVAYVGNPRLGTAVQMLRITDYIESNLQEVQLEAIPVNLQTNPLPVFLDNLALF